MEQIDTPARHAAQFSVEGRLISTEPYGSGHINDTFLVTTRAGDTCRRYIMQHVNAHVFRNPREVMDNILSVTGHLRNAIDRAGEDLQVLTVVLTLCGDAFWTDPDGSIWRMYRFVENAVSYDRADTPALFCESGRGFGDFFRLLADYPAETLFETIPHFHDTPARMRQLHEAIVRDLAGKAANVQREIAFALERETLAGALYADQQSGALPLRVTHNDTKLNNLLLDARTGRSVCVIDLDTVMPGLIAYDFGDSIRFGASTCPEDERELARCHFSIEMFEAFARGYLERAGGCLTDAELRSLPLGAIIMTLECGVRFLADHLNGDVYFKIHRPDHNLDRCRTQFRLVEEMEQKRPEMERIIAAIRRSAAAR